MGTVTKRERGRDNERNIKHVTENYTMLYTECNTKQSDVRTLYKSEKTLHVK